jgi:hypothetical protein
MQSMKLLKKLQVAISVVVAFITLHDNWKLPEPPE